MSPKEELAIQALLNQMAAEIFALSMTLRGLFRSNYFNSWGRRHCLLNQLFLTGWELDRQFNDLAGTTAALQHQLPKVFPAAKRERWQRMLAQKRRHLRQYKFIVQQFVAADPLVQDQARQELRRALSSLAEEISYYDYLLDLQELGFKIKIDYA